MTKTLLLSESIGFEEATLNPGDFTIRQRVIVAGTSKNGRHYSNDVLSEAAPKLQGVKTYANHGDGPRSVREITGYLTDPAYDPETGAIYATRHVVGEARDWLWPLIVEVVEGKAPGLLGCSINAIGKGRKEDNSVIIQHIERFHSVDDVTEPAAGGGFLPLAAGVGDSLGDALIGAMDYEEWTEARPDYVARMKREWKTTRQTHAVRTAKAGADKLREALEEVQAERDRLLAENAKLREQVETAGAESAAELLATRRELAVIKALEGVQLPTVWRDSLRERLMEAEAEQWPAVIQQEIDKAKQARSERVPVRGGGVVVAEALNYNPLDPAPRDGENVDQWLKRTRSK